MNRTPVLLAQAQSIFPFATELAYWPWGTARKLRLDRANAGMRPMIDPANQLELVGLHEAVRRAELGPTASVRSRTIKRLTVEHELLSSTPSPEDLAYLHSGFCQTALPHSRPLRNNSYWRRTNGKFTLIVQPGVLDISHGPNRKLTQEDNDAGWVGVPYGPKARLILIHLQTEGMKSQVVPLGANLSAFLRSLGLPVSGGPRGSIKAVKEQCFRIARCSLSLQWSDITEGGKTERISDTRIVSNLEMVNSASDEWSGTVELSDSFYSHLKQHAVPLDRRALSLLMGTSLGLDLYTLCAHRLPRLSREFHLDWATLRGQIGTEIESDKELGRHAKRVLPLLKKAYPAARIEATNNGLLLKPSPHSVPPRTFVAGTAVNEIAKPD